MGTAADILLVEDDDDLCAVLSELLAEYGHVVATACHGEEALRYLRAADTLPKVILLDLTMPVMTGAEFCGVRRQDPQLAAIPVFLLTARGDPEAHVEALGATGAFRKPLDLTKLLDTLSDVLDP